MFHARQRAGIGVLGELLAIGDRIVGAAGAGEQVEVMVGRGASTSVKVHDGEVESLTSAGSAGAGVRVIREGRVGFAHCGSLDDDVLADTLAEARDNCRFAEPDEANALAVDDGVEVRPQQMWFDEVMFENLASISNPRPSMPTVTRQVFLGETVTAEGTMVTFDVEGTDHDVQHMPAYFTYSSSDPSVATWWMAVAPWAPRADQAASPPAPA